MSIEPFSLQDIPAATALTYAAWGDELAEESEAFRHFVCEAMVRYYFRTSAFSYRLSADGCLQAFLLAADYMQEDASSAWFLSASERFTQREQVLARQYLAYLHFNGERLRECAAEDDLLLLLFVSRMQGAGSTLLENAVAVARAAGLKRLHLWADETCDYGYYCRRGFAVSRCFTNEVLPQLGAQATYIYSKEL